MKKSAVTVVTLEYSREELQAIIHKHIFEQESCYVDEIEYGETVVFKCHVRRPGQPPEEKVKIDINQALIHKKSYKNKGLSDFLKSAFEDGSQWPQAKLLEYCHEANFDLDSAKLRTILKFYPYFKEFVIERDPEVWQLKTAYNQIHENNKN